MTDIWLPGYERWPLGLPGLTYDETEHPKCVWHSTQGFSIESAVGAYRAYPPQLIVDPGRRGKVQHIPLNRGGYSLFNSEADDEFAIQVEVVGFAEQMADIPEDQLRWLGEEVARPLHEIMGVPYVVIRHGFRGAGGGIILADSDSPIRVSLDEMRSFSGHMAHQHVPGDTHWDIGGFPIHRCLTYAQGTAPAIPLPVPEEDPDMSNLLVISLTHEPLPKEDPNHWAPGSAVLIDLLNDRTTQVDNNNALGMAEKYKNAGALGCSGAQFADFLNKYGAGNPNPAPAA